MPRRDLITIDGWSEYGLNVFDSVGVGGANNPGDVMVVQAMFRYLHDLNVQKDHLQDYKHLWDGMDLEPTGIFDVRTKRTIIHYQQSYWYAVLSTDGIVHPAKYENRKITTGNGKRLMTITHLHQELWMAEDNGKDYTREIAKNFPNVAFWIRS